MGENFPNLVTLICIPCRKCLLADKYKTNKSDNAA
jgi:hypothetical protein